MKTFLNILFPFYAFINIFKTLKSLMPEIGRFVLVSFSLLIVMYAIFYAVLLFWMFLFWSLPDRFPIPFTDLIFLDRFLLLTGIMVAIATIPNEK